MKFLLWLSFHYGCIYVFNLVYFGLESNMVGTCVVYGCTNRQEKGGNISFFHFPHKNPPVLKQWANAVNRLHWFPKNHSLICSVHFKESCFTVRPGKRGRLLKDGAVPTEFPTHPSHLHQTRKRKSPKKRDIQEPLMNKSPSKVKIESALVEQFGPDIFNNVDNHFFDHHISQERDHLTSLLRLVVKRYLNLRLKTYGKKYTEMIAHKNLPSSRHELTKTILFLNQ